MAATSIQIDNYQCYVFSSRESSQPPSTVILLYDSRISQRSCERVAAARAPGGA
jgi:hypothetical protein